MGEKPRFWIVLAILIGIATFAAIVCLWDVTEAHARSKDDAVVVIADPIILLQIGTAGECTGFVTRAFSQTVIGTAGHCAEAAEGRITTAKDSIGREFRVHAIYVDKVHDLAIFAPDAGMAGPTEVSPLACDVPVNIGDEVSMIGFPLDYGRVTTFGKVSAQPSAWAHWPEVYRLDIFAGPGNSGSPVYNKAGQVIAILVGGNPQWVGMSLAVPVSEFCHPYVG